MKYSVDEKTMAKILDAVSAAKYMHWAFLLNKSYLSHVDKKEKKILRARYRKYSTLVHRLLKLQIQQLRG